MKVEEYLNRIDNWKDDDESISLDYLCAKLREAVAILKVRPDGRCPLCTRTQKHMTGHYPDCPVQNFLEGEK